MLLPIDALTKKGYYTRKGARMLKIIEVLARGVIVFTVLRALYIAGELREGSYIPVIIIMYIWIVIPLVYNHVSK